MNVDMVHVANVEGFEKKILSLNLCPGILNAKLIDGQLIYDTEGYVPVGEFDFIDLDHLLGTLYKLVLIVDECEDYLLNSSKLFLTKDKIFIGVRNGKLRLMFGDENQDGFISKFEVLLNSLSESIDVMGGQTALEQISKSIKLENPKMKGLLRIIEEIKREWNYIQPN